MRPIILIVLIVSVTALKAQTFIPGGFTGNNDYMGMRYNSLRLHDSSLQKKWFFSSYSALSSGFSLFKGGHATIISAPIGLQLNRKLNNNLYAFAGVSVAPAYVNFRQSFMANDFNKTTQNNAFFNASRLGAYSRAELGLQYINDEKTFSISGSIGIERSSYPAFLYGGQMNNTNTNHVFPTNNR